METKAWLIEEFDSTGKLVWKITSFFEPDAIQWEKDKIGRAHV